LRIVDARLRIVDAPLGAGPAGTKSTFQSYAPCSAGGTVALELATEFRSNALECLRLSREAVSIASQVHWISMAQLWFQLAQHAEDREPREPIASVNASAIDAANGTDDHGTSN
jgi:hypothetical protein